MEAKCHSAAFPARPATTADEKSWSRGPLRGNEAFWLYIDINMRAFTAASGWSPSNLSWTHPFFVDLNEFHTYSRLLKQA